MAQWLRACISLLEDPSSISKWLAIALHFAPVTGTVPHTYVVAE